MRNAVCSLLLVAVASTPWSASAADFVAPDKPQGGGTVVIGAQPVEPEAWPATFIFRNDVGGCTSTAVGDRVILTAAHCVTDGEQGAVSLPSGAIKVVCDHHPQYATGNASTDFALCLAEQPMSGFAFEKVSASLADARPGSAVTLLGYGCTSKGGFDGSFGVLHVGPATVTRGPMGDDIDTVTEGGAALCFGDSGGAAYFTANASLGTRVIIGVNSRGDISTRSFLSSTATPSFVEWALTWAQSRAAAICGLNPDAKGCRT